MPVDPCGIVGRGDISDNVIDTVFANRTVNRSGSAARAVQRCNHGRNPH